MGLSVKLGEVEGVRISGGFSGTHTDRCVADLLVAGPRACPLTVRVLVAVSYRLLDRVNDHVSSRTDASSDTANNDGRAYEFSDLALIQLSSVQLS